MAAFAAALVGALAGGGIMYFAGRQDVRAYLLEHPEVLNEATARLRQRETAAQLAPRRAELERPFHSAWAGAADGDVVLVEFFDYACGFCLSSNADIDRLLREDSRLKVVWREYPVLGPDSDRAAVASLAAARAGRFRDFYNRLFASGRPSEASVAAASESFGVTGPEFTAEDRAELERNMALAAAIGAQGTPTFVIGDEVLHGAVGYDLLRKAIAQARRRG
ncbi:MAG: DsbA family protein [Sphingosinicella sp.]